MHRRESVHLNYSLLPESLSNVGRELGSLTRSWESRWPTFKFTDTIRYAIFPNRLTIIDENYDFILLFFFSFLLLFSLFFFFDRFLIEGVLFFFLFFLEIGFHIINRRCSMRFVSILFFLFLFEINNFLRRSWMYWMLRILRFPPSKRYNHLRRIDTNSKSIFISWSVRFVYLLFERNFSFYLSN